MLQLGREKRQREASGRNLKLYIRHVSSAHEGARAALHRRYFREFWEAVVIVVGFGLVWCGVAPKWLVAGFRRTSFSKVTC